MTEDKAKLNALLMNPKTAKRAIIKYAKSRNLDVDDLALLAAKYAHVVTESGPETNPLSVACMVSKPNVVSALIQEGYAKTGEICGYLQVALDFGNIPVAHLLLEKSADACSLVSDGGTLMEAALSGRKEEKRCISAVELLLEAGVSVNAPVQSKSKERPLHLATTNNFPSVVSFLLQKDADANIADLHGFTPFHYACFENKLEIIKLFTLHKGDFYKENKFRDSALSIVVKEFFKEALNVLISGGCDINSLLLDGTSSVIGIAVNECDLEKLKYLVSLGADPKKKLKSGNTPLHILSGRVRWLDLAVESKKIQASLAIADFLVETGVNINAVAKRIFTPLILAVESKDYKLAKHFLKLGANVNVLFTLGKGILFHEVASSNNDVITHFLEFGADYCKRHPTGLTAYHIAIAAKVNLKFIKSFVQFGCPYNQDVSVWKKSKVCGSDEFNQFFKAEAQFFKGIRDNSLKLVQKAVGNGAVVTGCSEGCLYPLHFLAFHGYNELLTYLLENAFPVNTVNNQGVTALFVAAKRGHYDICCTLLQFGACYNYCSKKCSKTPKMIAGELKHKSIVDLFENVARMFHFAKTGSKRLVENLKKILDRSHAEYSMYANTVNVKQDTLMATTLSFKHSENAKKIMELRILSSLPK